MCSVGVSREHAYALSLGAVQIPCNLKIPFSFLLLWDIPGSIQQNMGIYEAHFGQALGFFFNRIES